MKSDDQLTPKEKDNLKFVEFELDLEPLVLCASLQYLKAALYHDNTVSDAKELRARYGENMIRQAIERFNEPKISKKREECIRETYNKKYYLSSIFECSEDLKEKDFIILKKVLCDALRDECAFLDGEIMITKFDD